MPYGRSGPPTVIDVGATDTRKGIVGGIVAGTIGLIAIVAGLFGAVDGGAVAGIIAIVIGAVFLLIGLLPVMMHRKAFRPRKLIVEQPGIRWDDPQGRPWAVAWGELAAVSISKHGALKLPESASEKIVGATTEKLLGENVLVRLDFYPADLGFRGRHPELEHLWEFQDVKGGYRLPLGKSPKYIPLIDAAARHFAPTIYRGVHQTEGFMGLA